jgi:hypothetical protein
MDYFLVESEGEGAEDYETNSMELNGMELNGME